jgi:hypothetical protein
MESCASLTAADAELSSHETCEDAVCSIIRRDDGERRMRRRGEVDVEADVCGFAIVEMYDRSVSNSTVFEDREADSVFAVRLGMPIDIPVGELSCLGATGRREISVLRAMEEEERRGWRCEEELEEVELEVEERRRYSAAVSAMDLIDLMMDGAGAGRGRSADARRRGVLVRVSHDDACWRSVGAGRRGGGGGMIEKLEVEVEEGDVVVDVDDGNETVCASAMSWCMLSTVAMMRRAREAGGGEVGAGGDDAAAFKEGLSDTPSIG